LTNFELTNRYDPEKVIVIEKFNPETVVSAVYYDAEQDNFFVKRFKIETQTTDKPFTFISESKGSRLIVATTEQDPELEIEYLKGRPKKEFSEKVKISDLIGVKGWKARGNRLSRFQVTYVGLAEDDGNNNNNESDLPPVVTGKGSQLNLFED